MVRRTLPDSEVRALSRKLDLGGNGPRVAIKDSLDIAGYPTTCGSRAFADGPAAPANADVVQSLLDHGCRIVGKARMHELAYGVTGVNQWSGTPVNPLFPDRIVGGSSSGSAAAVAAGLADFAIGTDTGGSIRMPAACCGIFGMKPTFGAVSRKGAIPKHSSLDCIGPFAAGMAGIISAMAMICPGFVQAGAPGRPRIGMVQVDADEQIMAVLNIVANRAEADFDSVELPSLTDAFRAGLTIIGAEMASELGYLCEGGLLQPDVQARLEAARAITPVQMAEAEEVRIRFAREVDEALAGRDALMLPTLPCVPPLLAELTDPRATLRLTELVRPFNLSGHPALSLPALTAKGLPAAIQLVGRCGGDAALCAVGTVLEAALENLALSHSEQGGGRLAAIPE